MNIRYEMIDYMFTHPPMADGGAFGHFKFDGIISGKLFDSLLKYFKERGWNFFNGDVIIRHVNFEAPYLVIVITNFDGRNHRWAVRFNEKTLEFDSLTDSQSVSKKEYT